MKLFAWILIFLHSALGLAHNQCQALFYMPNAKYLKQHNGFLTTNHPFEEANAFEVFKLGQGYITGGSVYRLHHDYLIETLKKYNKRADSEYTDININMLEDVHRFQILQEVYRSTQPATSHSFKVARVVIRGKNTLQIENIVGTPLDHIIEDRNPNSKNYPSQFSAYMNHQYKFAIEDLIHRLKQKAIYQSHEESGWIQTRYKEKLIYFFIKPNNIIVTPDMSLWIIDPY